MAEEPAGAYINLIEMKFIDDTLYFIPENDDLESDHFARLEPIHAVIRNVDDQVLFINGGKQPVFEDMTDAELAANRVQLIIYTYKDDNARGLAVTISVKEKKMSTLSCKDKLISFEEMDPPKDIRDTESDLIFFQRSVPGFYNKMVFESSLYEGYFLACKQENDLFKLILKKMMTMEINLQCSL